MVRSVYFKFISIENWGKVCAARVIITQYYPIFLYVFAYDYT